MLSGTKIIQRGLKMKLIPKNWKSFQHYKDRNPPWVKLHKTLLDDRDFSRLPIASKALAPMLWLLASESKDGIFDGSVEEIAFRLRWSEKDVTAGLKPLIDKGLFSIASGVLADCYQDARPETETETETETKRETKVDTPEGVSDDLWKDFMVYRKRLKAPVTDRVLNRLIKEAELAKMPLADVLETIMFKGWRSFEASWIQQSAQKAKELPLGTDQQIEEAYRVECGGDPRLARFNSYFEMKKFIQEQRDKRVRHA